MTARASIHRPSIDAISAGFQAALLAYPGEPASPTADWARRCARAAGLGSAVLYLDDWHRGVALAGECVARAFAGLPRDTRGERMQEIARLAASGATDEQIEDWSATEIEAWDLLCAFEQCVAETGDPDTERERNDPDEWESVAGDDEQGAVLSRLRWAEPLPNRRRVLVSTPWEDCPP